MCRSNRFVLCVALVLVALTMGVSAGGRQEATTVQAVEVTAPGQFPIVTQPTTLRVMATPSIYVEDMYTNHLTLWYEELTGVSIEWDIIPNTAGWEERVSLRLASQSNLPDAMLSHGVPREWLIVYGAQGLFMDLTGYIDRLGWGIHHLLEYNDTFAGQIVAPDGKIYGLPALNECYHCSMAQKMWINERWLERLGLQMPTTTEEFYRVLVAFRDNDANGSGRANDEVPLAIANGWHGSADSFIMNSFIFNSGMNTPRLYVEDGQIRSAADQPEWRDGLRFLRRLYAEGLMDREAFTADTAHVRMLTGGPDGNIVGAAPGGHMYWLDYSTDLKDEFVIVPPLTGPTGIRQTALTPPALAQGAFVVMSNASQPEVAYRWGDGMYTFGLGELNWRGRENIDWRWAEPGEVGLDGEPALYAMLWGEQDPPLAFGDPMNSWWYGLGPEFNNDRMRSGIVYDDSVWNLEKILFDATSIYDPYGVAKMLPPLFMDLDSVAEHGELTATLTDYIEESIARFVIGELDLDRDWDRYLAELRTIGYHRLVDMTQRAYDRQYGGQ